MILEVQTELPRALVQECLAQDQVPNLWPALKTDIQGQLALSWASLIVHMRQPATMESCDERPARR